MMTDVEQKVLVLKTKYEDDVDSILRAKNDEDILFAVADLEDLYYQIQRFLNDRGFKIPEEMRKELIALANKIKRLLEKYKPAELE